jgi:subtilisin family serine protease
MPAPNVLIATPVSGFEQSADVPAAMAQRAIEAAAGQLGVAPESLRIEEQTTLLYPVLEVEGFHFKVSGSEEGSAVAIALDTAGNLLDPEGLESAESEAFRARYGNLDPNLVEHLATQPATLPVQVLLWLSLPPYDPPDRLDPETEWSEDDIDAFYQQVDAERAAFLEPFVSAVRQQLDQLGIETEPAPLAPVLSAAVLPSQLAELASWKEIDRVYLSQPLFANLSTANPTITANLVHARGRTGIGVHVAQIEVGGRVDTTNPFLSRITQDPANVCASPRAGGGHSTAVAGIMKSFDIHHRGIAPAAALRAGGSCSGVASELMSATDRATLAGARVLNYSLGRDIGRQVDGFSRFLDDVVANRFRTVVAAAGNSAWCFVFFCGSANVESPGTGLNVLTVGGLDDRDTASRRDDTMYGDSSWRNPISRHGGRDKPELVAPAVDLQGPHGFGGLGHVGSGTSFAAPAVTGGAALLIQANRTLAVWPEAIKAILIATALHNIEGNRTRSPKDGAGGIMLFEADQVAVRKKGNWGTLRYRCRFAPLRDRVTSVQLRAGIPARAALVFSTRPGLPDYPDQPSTDLDLVVTGPSGNTIASSRSFDNTYEAVEFQPTQAGTYSIDIIRHRCDADPPFAAWAWWQDS